jgi:hypothetical protein
MSLTDPSAKLLAHAKKRLVIDWGEAGVRLDRSEAARLTPTRNLRHLQATSARYRPLPTSLKPSDHREVTAR